MVEAGRVRSSGNEHHIKELRSEKLASAKEIWVDKKSNDTSNSQWTLPTPTIYRIPKSRRQGKLATRKPLHEACLEEKECAVDSKDPKNMPPHDAESFSSNDPSRPEKREFDSMASEHSKDSASPQDTSIETIDTCPTSGVASDTAGDRSKVANKEDIESSNDLPVENKVQKNLEDKGKKYMKILVLYGWSMIIVVAIFILSVVLRENKFKKLRDLGYPHTKGLKAGWLFDANLDTALTSFSYYTSVDLAPSGTATEIDCAKQCSRESAFAGAWNNFYLECWCYFDVPEANFCFEPCIIETGIEFSTHSFDNIDYCNESYCEIFDARDYCNFREYNPDLCLDV
eukprot:scaffold1377_cov126-Cylindrotheca_fusiformis.AAC.30